MLERTTRPPGAARQGPPPRPNGRQTQATQSSLRLRSTLWGSVTLVLIGFLGWLIFWANETGAMLP
jgi:hypothetical protein